MRDTMPNFVGVTGAIFGESCSLSIITLMPKSCKCGPSQGAFAADQSAESDIHRMAVLPRALGLLRILRGLLFLVPWLLHLLIADLLLCALLPASAVLPTLAYNISSGIAESVWRGIQWLFTSFNCASIIVAGDTLPRGETALLVSNHVEWTDFYMIQELAIRAGMLSRCRWFAKQQLKWVPFLGWGLWAMGMPLVSRKWMQDEKEINRVFHGVINHRWPMCKSGAG